MALLSAADKAMIQSAIDLMVKGTAYETPLADDVIERLAPLVESPTFSMWGMTKGDVYASLRDHPVSGMITFAIECGQGTLTQAQEDTMREANRLMLLGSAREMPFDATVVEILAPVAEATNFLTKGGFKAAIADRPFSTMLQWGLKLGS